MSTLRGGDWKLRAMAAIHWRQPFRVQPLRLKSSPAIQPCLRLLICAQLSPIALLSHPSPHQRETSVLKPPLVIAITLNSSEGEQSWMLLLGAASPCYCQSWSGCCIGHGLLHLRSTDHLAQPIPHQDVPALPGRMLCILHCALPAHLDLALASLTLGAQ